MISGYEMYQEGIASHFPFTCPIDCESAIQGPYSFSSRFATSETSTRTWS